MKFKAPAIFVTTTNEKLNTDGRDIRNNQAGISSGNANEESINSDNEGLITPERSAVLTAGKFLRVAMGDYYANFADTAAIHRLHRKLKGCLNQTGQKYHKLSIKENCSMLKDFEFNKNFAVAGKFNKKISAILKENIIEFSLNLNNESDEIYVLGVALISDFQLNNFTGKFECIEERGNGWGKFIELTVADIKKNKKFSIDLEEPIKSGYSSVVIFAGVQSETTKRSEKGLCIIEVL
ncbi:MAG: hypothetical protein ACK40G_01845 [Cytophagaceae bacterium]